MYVLLIHILRIADRKADLCINSPAGWFAYVPARSMIFSDLLLHPILYARITVSLAASPLGGGWLRDHDLGTQEIAGSFQPMCLKLPTLTNITGLQPLSSTEAEQVSIEGVMRKWIEGGGQTVSCADAATQLLKREKEDKIERESR